MPVMDGIEACRQICRRQGGHARAPVVFVTAHASGDYESEGKKAGGRGFLTKPVSLNTIKECLETLCCNGHVETAI
jgi:CheY-like chemotaxis protein